MKVKLLSCLTALLLATIVLAVPVALAAADTCWVYFEVTQVDLNSKRGLAVQCLLVVCHRLGEPTCFERGVAPLCRILRPGARSQARTNQNTRQ